MVGFVPTAIPRSHDSISGASAFSPSSMASPESASAWGGHLTHRPTGRAGARSQSSRHRLTPHDRLISVINMRTVIWLTCEAHGVC